MTNQRLTSFHYLLDKIFTVIVVLAILGFVTIGVGALWYGCMAFVNAVSGR
jgi:hypothetical protein